MTTFEQPLQEFLTENYLIGATDEDIDAMMRDYFDDEHADERDELDADYDGWRAEQVDAFNAELEATIYAY